MHTTSAIRDIPANKTRTFKSSIKVRGGDRLGLASIGNLPVQYSRPAFPKQDKAGSTQPTPQPSCLYPLNDLFFGLGTGMSAHRTGRQVPRQRGCHDRAEHLNASHLPGEAKGRAIPALASYLFTESSEIAVGEEQPLGLGRAHTLQAWPKPATARAVLVLGALVAVLLLPLSAPAAAAKRSVSVLDGTAGKTQIIPRSPYSCLARPNGW